MKCMICTKEHPCGCWKPTYYNEYIMTRREALTREFGPPVGMYKNTRTGPTSAYVALGARHCKMYEVGLLEGSEWGPLFVYSIPLFKDCMDTYLCLCWDVVPQSRAVLLFNATEYVEKFWRGEYVVTTPIYNSFVSSVVELVTRVS